MGKICFDQLAREIYASSPDNRDWRFSDIAADNRLFRTVFDRYCFWTKQEDSFDSVCDRGAISKAFEEVASWYYKRYGECGFNMPIGHRGERRAITVEDVITTRSVPLNINNGNDTAEDSEFEKSGLLTICSRRTLVKYLMPSTPLPQSPEAKRNMLNFIMHMGVAFAVRPSDLDNTLKYYGFHPLHAKNPYHLAIFTVLSECEYERKEEGQPQVERKSLPNNYNPLGEVGKLYKIAREILSGGGISAPIPTEDEYTAFLRKDWIEERGLTRDNFEKTIEEKKSVLKMRHTLILNDLNKFRAVYLILDDLVKKNQASMSTRYSPYGFISRYCKAVKEKVWKFDFDDQISKNHRHPTRELMIILWFFAYCFSRTKGIDMTREEFERIQRRLKTSKLQEEATTFYLPDEERFDIGGFLYEKKNQTNEPIFRGPDLITDINEKLGSRYGWGQLNRNRSFDYMFLQIQRISKIDMYERNGYRNAREVVIDGKKIISPRDPYIGVDGVICPLTIVDGLLSSVKGCSDESKEYFPLGCHLYEYV